MLGIAANPFPKEIVPLIPALQNGPLLTIHVSVMMLSYAVLTVAFCGAVVYLAQGGEGKRRFAALPSADAAGDLAHKAVMVEASRCWGWGLRSARGGRTARGGGTGAGTRRRRARW
ncbi:cytochrome c biogenesis protein CcsA [Tepidiforma flava]|uniref:Cytochrome c biogenesis protein CcsA n=1 Tax=Tepidiforma flava TaxID=3004094 RepID=A0ABY7M486_9CHLR|nr:cytochrome c biogenesis protein CcsA [Tepidiforma flava]WBL34977.1 cytochrome c biogenesis protein CcsA [Tepidiforma flava]